MESRKLMMEERNGGIAEPMSLCRREAMGFGAQEGLLFAGAGIIHLKQWVGRQTAWVQTLVLHSYGISASGNSFLIHFLNEI